MCFKVFPNAYSTTDKKVFYVLSLFQTGLAKVWKDQYVEKQANQANLAPGNDWAAFKTDMTESFNDPGSKQDARKALHNLRQGKMSVDELNVKFRLLVGKSGLDTTASKDLLIDIYRSALNDNVRQQIILNGTEPDTLDAYYTRASTVDREFKMANIRSAFSGYSKNGRGGGGNQKPNYNWPSSRYDYQGVPMDVDAIATMSNGNFSCYNCGEKGHYTNRCKKPKKAQNPQNNRGNSRGRGQGNFRGRGHRGNPQQ